MARRGVTLTIENLPEFLADLERVGSSAEKACSYALREEAQQMLDRSDILVPVDQGDLLGSGFVGLVNRWARGLEIKFGYGEPYAIYQHFGHYEHDDGQRLFLERGAKYSRKGLADRLRAALRRFLAVRH